MGTVFEFCPILLKKDLFPAKKGRSDQNGILIESGVLLTRIRYVEKNMPDILALKSLLRFFGENLQWTVKLTLLIMNRL